MTKTAFPAIRDYMKEHHGWSASAPEVQQWVKEENELFSQFEGKRVKIKFSAESDWLAGNGEAVGKIIKAHNGNWFFLPKGKRTHGKNLTTGLFHGSYATYSVLEVDPV